MIIAGENTISGNSDQRPRFDLDLNMLTTENVSSIYASGSYRGLELRTGFLQITAPTENSNTFNHGFLGLRYNDSYTATLQTTSLGSSQLLLATDITFSSFLESSAILYTSINLGAAYIQELGDFELRVPLVLSSTLLYVPHNRETGFGQLDLRVPRFDFGISLSWRDIVNIYYVQEYSILPSIDHHVFDPNRIALLPNMREIGMEIFLNGNRVDFNLRAALQISNIFTKLDVETSLTFDISQNFSMDLGVRLLYTHWNPAFNTSDDYRVSAFSRFDWHGSRVDISSEIRMARQIDIEDRQWEETRLDVEYRNSVLPVVVDTEYTDDVIDRRRTAIVRHFFDMIVAEQMEFDNLLFQVDQESVSRTDMTAHEYIFLFVTSMHALARGLYDNEAMDALKDELNLDDWRLRRLTEMGPENLYRIIRESLGESDFFVDDIDPSGTVTGYRVAGNARGRYVCNNMADFQSYLLHRLGINNFIMRSYSHIVVFVPGSDNYRGRIVDGSMQVVGQRGSDGFDDLLAAYSASNRAVPTMFTDIYEGEIGEYFGSTDNPSSELMRVLGSDPISFRRGLISLEGRENE